MMSEQILCNEELGITFPSEFHVMDPEERKKMNMLSDGDGVCLSAPDLHIIISIGWKSAKGLFGKLLNDNDFLKSMEKSISKAQKPYGFQLQEYTRRTIGNKTAEGFLYTYRAQSLEMCSESLVLKRNQTVYYFHIYFHADRQSESLDIWDKILTSAKWNEQ